MSFSPTLSYLLQGSKIIGAYLTKYFVITTTLLLLFLLIVSASFQSIQEKSWTPLRERVAYRVLLADNSLYTDVSEYEKNGRKASFFEKLEIFTNAWIMVCLVNIAYLAIKGSNDGMVYRNIGLAIIIVLVIQVIAGVYFFYESGKDVAATTTVGKAKELFMTANPVKGFVKFLGNLGYLLQPTVDTAIDVLE